MVASGSNDENADDVVFYLVGEFENCVEWRDKSGMTALAVAAKAGNDASINILLDAGADINAVDPLGNTPLHYASAYGHLKAMRTLMDRGANFDVRNREGWYPKDYSYSKAAETYFKTLIDGVTIKNVNTMGQYTPTASNPFAGLMGPGGISSSVRTAGNFIPSGGFGMGGVGGAQTAPSSRDGSKRPSTAGSFSYGSHSIMGGSTATLVPSNTGGGGGGGGGTPMLPNFAPAMGQLGSTITLISNSGTATPMDYDLPPPPSRVLKSAASMVEFSRMDRGSMTARPGTPQSTYSSNMGEREFSSPLAGRGGGEREGRADGGRHSAAGSVSSYASVGSVGSMHGGGLPVLMQGQQMQQMGQAQGQQQGQQQGSGQQQQRALYEAFTKLRPRASSNG
ncbi:hypothetical protein TWF102_008271 [Orbilia oligospora]|uniref:Uncharacterized protein n=1 Tax=Orbilia oligospora TaxID=2813651 RepID=A0A7C8JCJ6_ORBOL|nr:hypothetical protein TWF103_001939 [Orbilia oligospora]KAF3110708.1 hypothetical protein TWF102_008271 [Orbilia oligospora]